MGTIVPGTEWTTGAAILADLSIGSPAPDQTEWADACAAAVNGGFDSRLDGAVFPDDPIASAGAIAELTYAALRAGVEAYKRREAPFGLTGYVDLQGAAVRIARDYLEGVAPIIARHATVGIG